ncbi:putative thioredoxin [Escherichia phage JLBYU31]|nr:putative thioredoxin [Escherichia phage JLBYU31]
MSVVINNVNAVIKSLVNKKLNEWTVLRRGEPDKFFHRFNPTLDLNVIDRDVHAEILDKFKVDIGFGLEKHLQRTNGSGMSLSNRIMKALNKIGALSRINASEILRNYNKGYDLYGRLMPKLSFDQMIADLWENQRRLLALGARLAKGLDKQMIFKTNNTEDLKCFKFSIRGDDYYIRARSTDYVNMGHHLCLAFEVLKEVGTLEYSSGAKCPIGSSCILIYRPDESSLTKLPTKPVPVRSNEKHSEQIDYFNKQIEELNISIQQYDDEIFRLSGLSSKAKSEREKLIKIVDLLKS